MNKPVGGSALQAMIDHLNSLPTCPYCRRFDVRVIHHKGGDCSGFHDAKCEKDHEHGVCRQCLTDWIIKVDKSKEER